MDARTLVLTLSVAVAQVAWTPMGHAQQLRRLLYAGVPGVGNATNHGSVGILVFDIDKGYTLAKR